jgi:hypothetical protein
LLLLKTAANCRPPIRLGLRLSDESRAAGRQAAVPWGLAGEREENEAELGVVFGPNPGAIVHFSTSSLTRPPKRIAARAASQRLPRPFAPSGLGSPAWSRNCAITLKILVATLLRIESESSKHLEGHLPEARCQML